MREQNENPKLEIGLSDVGCHDNILSGLGLAPTKREVRKNKSEKEGHHIPILDIERLCSKLKGAINEIEEAEKTVPAERFRITLRHLTYAKQRLNLIIKEIEEKAKR